MYKQKQANYRQITGKLQAKYRQNNAQNIPLYKYIKNHAKHKQNKIWAKYKRQIIGNVQAKYRQLWANKTHKTYRQRRQSQNYLDKKNWANICWRRGDSCKKKGERERERKGETERERERERERE